MEVTMQKLKMVMVAGVLVAVTVFSIAGLCFSDDAQPAPDATGSAVMSTAPDGLATYSIPAPDGLAPYSVPPAY